MFSLKPLGGNALSALSVGNADDALSSCDVTASVSDPDLVSLASGDLDVASAVVSGRVVVSGSFFGAVRIVSLVTELAEELEGEE